MNDAISNKIRTSFNKASKTYDRHCCVQKDTAAALCNAIYNYSDNYNRVADFACGTGISTKFITSLLRFNKLYAVDFAEKLLAVAQRKLSHSGIEWILSDYNKKLFPSDLLSLVVCNLGLQWSLDLPYTIKLFHQYLKKNGVLAFSIPLSGTLCEMQSSYRNYSYKYNEVIRVLQQSQFELFDFRKTFMIKDFSSAIEAIKSIKAVGANCPSSQGRTQLRHALMQKEKIENVFLNTDNITLTYNMGIFLAKKKR